MSLQKLLGTGTGNAIIYHDKWGYQKAEETRQSINSLAAARRFAGALTVGSGRSSRYQNSSAAAFLHPDYWDLTIDWTEMAAGWTVRARLETITDNVTCSITPRIRNTTDGVNTDGASSSATTWTEQFIILPVPGVLGLKRYQLWMIPGLADTDVNVLGSLEIYG